MHDRWGFAPAILGRGFRSVGWAALKIPPVLWLERRVLPSWGYARGYEPLHAAPVAALWLCLLASYVYWALLVSAKFDLMIALFRFFGVNVEDNFRWPLLATSPVALWRRWNIYNRRLLLKFVYFPLGGNRTHVYRNIMATFLASAILLHTGFFGSPWWGVNPFQLRDWLLYFAGQGLIVCAALWWLQRPFWERAADGRGEFRYGLPGGRSRWRAARGFTSCRWRRASFSIRPTRRSSPCGSVWRSWPGRWAGRNVDAMTAEPAFRQLALQVGHRPERRDQQG